MARTKSFPAPSIASLRWPGRTNSLLVLALVVFAFSLLCFSSLPSANAGGGIAYSGAYSPPTWVTVSSAQSGNTGTLPNFIHNDYIVVVVAISGTAQHVSLVSDSASPATTFTQTASSSTNQDTEIWCGQYTAATGSDKITVQASASATFAFTFYRLGGLTSCTQDTGATAHGTSASMSVASFTPNTGDSCVVMGNEETSASSTFSEFNPFLTDGGANATPDVAAYASPSTYAVTTIRQSWNQFDGSTTATLTPSGTSSPNWDEVVSCFPTASAGNELYQQTNLRGGARSASNPSAGVDSILEGDYVVGLFASVGTSNTVGSMSYTATGITGSVSMIKAGSSDGHDDAEIWLGQAPATGTGPDIVTSSTNCSECYLMGINIGSIQSTTAQVQTSSSGTAGLTSASVSSFTPDADDLCMAWVSAVVTSSSATLLTSSNQPLQLTYSYTQQVSSTVELVGFAARADWPAGVSTTATFTLSTGTITSYDELVVCFPGTVIVPITCTMANSAAAATVTLSESSGNSLSPTTLSCDGASHSIAVDPSVTLTATEPAAGANTRDMFSGGVTMTTSSACAGSSSGMCSAWSFTNYEELQNTYQATTNGQGPPAWDSGLSAAVTGTVAGVGSSTICTISPSSGATTAASCTGWGDYNRAASEPSTMSGAGSNVRWMVSGTSSWSDTTGGNTHAGTYYKQLQNTYQAAPFSPSTWDISGLSLDGANDNICTAVTSCSTSLTTAHTNDVVVVMCYSNTVGSAGAVTDFTVSGGGLSYTQRLFYGNQKTTAEVYAISASTLSAASISCAVNAGAGNANIGIMAFGINGAFTASPYDANGALPNELSSSTSTGTCMISTSNPNDFLIGETTHNGASLNSIPAGFLSILAQGGSPSGAVDYQIVNSLQSAVSETWTYGAGSVSDNICDAVRAAISGVTVTGTLLGIPGQMVCITTLPTSGSSAPVSCSGYTDYNTATTMGYLAVSSNERWAPSTAGYTDTTGGNTHTDNYYEQLQNTFQVTANAQTTFDTGMTWTITGTLLGSAGSTVCSVSSTSAATDSCSGYSDYNAPATFPAASTGAPANARWENAAGSATNTAAITTGGNTFNVNYYKQLLNTYQAAPYSPSTWDTGLAPDGSAIGACTGTCSTSVSATLTTMHSNDVIVLYCAANTGGTINAPSAAGLSWTQRGPTISGNLREEAVFYAIATAPISESITCNFSANVNGYGEINVWAVNGANTVSPFDGNVNLPNGNGFDEASPASCTMTTSNSNDFLFVVMDNTVAPNLVSNPTNFTTLVATSGSTGANTNSHSAYYIVSSAQAGVTEDYSWSGGATPRGAIWCDALQAAGVTGVTATGSQGGMAGQTICVTGLPTSGSSTAISCSGWADYNSAVTMGYLTVSANERWSPATASYTDTSGGNTHTDNYFDQLQNTYQASPTAPATWDAALSIPVTGTQLGSAGTVCTISTSKGGGAAACTAYTDYDTLATVTSPITVSSNEVWSASTANTFTDTTGGNTHSVTYSDLYSFGVTDSYAMSDTASRGLALSRTGADSVTVSEVFAQESAFQRNAADVASESDTAIGQVAEQRPSADSFVFSESSASVASLFRPLTDTASYVEGLTASSAFARVASDSISYAESASRGLSLANLASDTYGFLEGAVQNALLSRGIADAGANAEQMTYNMVLSRAASETASFTETMMRALSLQQVASDSLSYVESVVRSLSLSRLSSDVAGVSEGIGANVLLGRAVVESFSFGESALRGISLQQLAADTASFSEAVSRFENLASIVADTSLFGESLGQNLTLDRLTSDAYSFGEASLGAVVLGRAAADLYSVSDAVGRSLSLQALVADGISFLATTQRLESIVAQVADVSPFSESGNGIVLLSRALSDLVTYTDSSARTLLLLENALDQYVFVDGFQQGSSSPPTVIAVSIGDAYTFTESVLHQSFLGRAISDVGVYGQTVQRELSLIANVLDDYDFTPVATRLVDLYGGVADALGSLASIASSVVQAVTSTTSSITSTITSSTGTGGKTGPIPPVVAAAIIFSPIVLLALLALLFLARRRKPKDADQPSSA